MRLIIVQLAVGRIELPGYVGGCYHASFSKKTRYKQQLKG
jgi:hypothetical protein